MDEKILKQFARDFRAKHLVPVLGRGRVCNELIKELDDLVTEYVAMYNPKAPDTRVCEKGDIAVNTGSFRVGEYESSNLKQRNVLLYLLDNIERDVPLEELATAVQARTQATTMAARALAAHVNSNSQEFSMDSTSDGGYRLSMATGGCIANFLGVSVCERAYSIGDYESQDDLKRRVLLSLLNKRSEVIDPADLAREWNMISDDISAAMDSLGEELQQHSTLVRIHLMRNGYMLK